MTTAFDLDFDAEPTAPAAPVSTVETRPDGELVHVTSVERALACLYRDSMYRSGQWLEPFRAPLVRGRAVHAARDHALKTYASRGALPPIDECLDAAATEVRASLEQECERGAEVPEGAGPPIVDEASRYVRADRMFILPSIAPHLLASEETLELPIEGEGLEGRYVLTGRIDAIGRSPIGGRLEVPDLKTSTAAPKRASVNCSTQHSLYSLLVEEKYGERPLHNIHHVRWMAKGPKTVQPGQRVESLGPDQGVAVLNTIATDRTKDDVAGAVRRLRFVLDAREHGWAAPAAASDFMSECYRCPHRGARDIRQRCPFVPAGRDGEPTQEDE